jgi:hypothetical protein
MIALTPPLPPTKIITPCVTTVSSVYDFLDRTITIGVHGCLGLELMAIYRVYKVYCETINIEPENYNKYLEDTQTAFPHSFRMIKTGHPGIPPIAFLLGLDYVKPKPWTDGKKKSKYHLNKTTTGNIPQINRKVLNEDLPTGIPEYWPDFARLTTIKSGNKMVLFSPYDYQVSLWELMQENQKIKIVKSRQLGITQIIISVFLHRACLNEAYTAVVFLRNAGDTAKIAWRNREMVGGLSKYITNLSDSLKYFKIKGGGDIHFMNASKEGSRSIDSVSDFMYDEAAFVDNIETIVAGSGASSAMVGEESTQVVLSTPNTKYGWFYNQFAEGNEVGFNFDKTVADVVEQKLPSFFVWDGTDGSKKVVIHWRAHPVYRLREDYVEYRRKLDGTSEEKARREYDLKFQNSEITVFAYEHVAQCMVGIYEADRDPSATYYMGIDTAGVGQNYTVGLMLKEFKVPNPAAPGTGLMLNAYKVVADYRQSKKRHAGDVIGLSKLVRTYLPRRIGVETFDGTGSIMAQKLIQLFPEIEIIMINSVDAAKAIQVVTLDVALEESRYLYPPGFLADELTVYSLIDGKFGAPTGYNDDGVSASLMGLTVAPFNEGDNRLIEISEGLPDENEFIDAR